MGVMLRRAAMAAGAAAVLLGPALALAGPAAALPANCVSNGGTTTCTYTTPGESTFAVPPGASTLHVVATGGAGTSGGGLGAVVTADISPKVSTLFVDIAGGGTGSHGNGGDAADIRTCSQSSCSLPGGTDTRLIVAGGGGGGGGGNSTQPGGNAGSVVSGICAPGVAGTPGNGASSAGKGGTCTAGGAAGTGSLFSGNPGSAGFGGSDTSGFSDSAGGGGGFYGGGSSGEDTGNRAGGGGGGGSSFAAASATNVTFALATNRPAASVTIAYTDYYLAIAQHGDITTDATSPHGATVTYTAPAVTDGDDPSPPAAVCTPPSGSVFPIGTTTVTCTATDPYAVNSPVHSSFTVTVLGAAAQLASLHQAVQGYGAYNILALTVSIAQHAVAAGNTGLACQSLTAFINDARLQLPAAKADPLIAAAKQIQAVLGCGTSRI